MFQYYSLEDMAHDLILGHNYVVNYNKKKTETINNVMQKAQIQSVKKWSCLVCTCKI